MTNEEFIKSISLEGEEWRDVVGYEGLYMASSLGRIISLPRKAYNGHVYFLTKHRVMSQGKKSNGYLVIVLYDKPNFSKTFYVHRLVAKAFCDNPCNKPHIDHINANKQDNRAVNLRWVTQKENNNNPITSNKISMFKKGKRDAKQCHALVSINENNNITCYPSISYLRALGLSWFKVHKCCTGKADTYNGLKWMYLSDYEALTNKSKNAIPNPN